MLRLLSAGFAIAAILAAGFPRPLIPEDNPMTEAKAELGRYLFYDKRISLNGKQSCGSCHRQELAFTDGQKHAEGSTGQLHPRSSMSLANVAYAATLTWANPSLHSLEEQVLIPMLGETPVELGLKGKEQQYLTVLKQDTDYQRRFAQAFPGAGEAFTIANVTKAIASFERTLISLHSPYDRYRWAGDAAAISDSAKRGEIIFFSSERGGCFQCHSGWNFSGPIRYDGATSPNDMGGFFNTGVTTYSEPNRGLYEQTRKVEDIGKFRAPSLRNIAVTAPYMHDGSISTLEEVIDHYTAGGKMAHPNKSRILRPFSISESERRDLVEFLKSLTDEEFLHDPRFSDPH